jgi:hypothetical protein
VGAACARTVPIQPAEGFNPRTASAAQLRGHGLPPRPPADERGFRRTWEHYISMYLAGKARMAGSCAAGERTPGAVAPSAPPRLSRAGRATPDSLGCIAGDTPTDWAGYEAHSNSYTDVEATWNVPTLIAGESGDLQSTWVGIGVTGSEKYPIVQAGEVSAIGKTPYVWTETYPDNPVTDAGVPIAPGQTLYVHVAFDYNGTAGFHIINETTGVSNAPTAQTFSGMLPDGHAEIVTENPDGTHYLADFKDIKFSTAEAASTQTGWQDISALPYYTETMYDCRGDEMANPESLSGASFTNLWDSRGFVPGS